MKTDFKINGIPIKRPSTFKMSRYNITTLTRLASGEMVGDLVAKKVKLFFTYEAITSTDLNTILDIIWNTNSLFYTVTYVENNIARSIKAYVGEIPQELHHTGDSEWVWQNVTFDLIQK